MRTVYLLAGLLAGFVGGMAVCNDAWRIPTVGACVAVALLTILAKGR